MDKKQITAKLIKIENKKLKDKKAGKLKKTKNITA